MPKAKVLTSGEFVNLATRAEKIKEYNRYAERINRQIRRLKEAKKKGTFDYSKVIPAKDLKQLIILKPGSKRAKGISQKRLHRMYDRLLNEKPDYRRAAVKEALKTKVKLESIINRAASGEKGGTITATQFRSYERMVKRATAESAAYYQLLRAANDRGIVSDYKLPEKWEKLDTKQVMDRMLRAVNRDIDKMNKQRRTPAAEKDARLTMRKLRQAGWEFEATTGQQRRNAPQWINITPEQEKELIALFGIK